MYEFKQIKGEGQKHSIPGALQIKGKCLMSNWGYYSQSEYAKKCGPVVTYSAAKLSTNMA